MALPKRHFDEQDFAQQLYQEGAMPKRAAESLAGGVGDLASEVREVRREVNAGFHALNERVSALGEQLSDVTRGLSWSTLLRLTRVSNGKAVLVNPGSVKQITTTRGGRTQVKYQDDSILVVQETVERIEELLNP